MVRSTPAMAARSTSLDARPPIDLEGTGLPTPHPSSPSPPFQSFHPSDHVPNIRLSGDGRLIGAQSLPPPESLTLPTSSAVNGFENESSVQDRRQPPTFDYILSSQAEDLPASMPLNAIPDIGVKPRRSARKQLQQATMYTPFASPIKDRQGGRSFMSINEGSDHGGLGPGKRRQRQTGSDSGLVAHGELWDLTEDPQPLTPPRRNRDMRDFVTSLDLTADDSAASLIESRNFAQQKSIPSSGNEVRDHQEQGDENEARRSGVLSGRGFIRVSELAAVEAHFGTQKTTAPRPTKRRKTSEARVLREISGNARELDQHGDQGYRPRSGSRALSNRRRTTNGNKVHRIKSSQLPLERVPEGQGTQHVIFKISTTTREISRTAAKIDEDLSLLSWNEPSMDAYTAFEPLQTPENLQNLTMKLRKMLINNLPNGEMVQDLGTLVRDAFATYKKINMDVEDL